MEKADKRILVVDDEQDLCEILSFNIQIEGYHVDTANSAEEALEMDIASYDLLLLDVMMGGMSGFQLAKKLKENPMTAHVPIIFLTARDTENDTLTGFNLGADDYISKPFSIREVMVHQDDFYPVSPFGVCVFFHRFILDNIAPFCYW